MLEELLGLFGTHDQQAMLDKAQSYATYTMAGRTVTLIIGAAVTVTSTVLQSPILATVSAMIGLSLMVLGQSLHALSQTVENAMDFFEQVGQSDDVGPLLQNVKRAYQDAQKKALLPLPRLEDLPVAGPFLTNCRLKDIHPEQVESYISDSEPLLITNVY